MVHRSENVHRTTRIAHFRPAAPERSGACEPFDWTPRQGGDGVFREQERRPRAGIASHLHDRVESDVARHVALRRAQLRDRVQPPLLPPPPVPFPPPRDDPVRCGDGERVRDDRTEATEHRSRRDGRAATLAVGTHAAFAQARRQPQREAERRRASVAVQRDAAARRRRWTAENTTRLYGRCTPIHWRGNRNWIRNATANAFSSERQPSVLSTLTGQLSIKHCHPTINVVIPLVYYKLTDRVLRWSAWKSDNTYDVNEYMYYFRNDIHTYFQSYNVFLHSRA